VRAWAKVEQPQGSKQNESVRKTVQALIPNPSVGQIRYDVFATEGMQAEQERIESGLRAAGAKNVRQRETTLAECADRWRVDRHGIRYDADNPSELSALATVKHVVKDALAIGLDKVVAGPINDKPTPLYMSIFLCKK
jgi:hypothetical protein